MKDYIISLLKKPIIRYNEFITLYIYKIYYPIKKEKLHILLDVINDNFDLAAKIIKKDNYFELHIYIEGTAKPYLEDKLNDSINKLLNQ